MRSLLLVLAPLIMFAGCTPGKTNIVTRLYHTAERSDQFQYGFMDGCGSGLNRKGSVNHMHFKDLNRYTGEYMLGWDAGYRQCLK